MIFVCGVEESVRYRLSKSYHNRTSRLSDLSPSKMFLGNLSRLSFALGRVGISLAGWNNRSGPGKPDRVWSLFISALPQAFLQHHHVLQIPMTTHGLFSNPAPAFSSSEAMSPISSRFYTFSRRPSDRERLVAKAKFDEAQSSVSLAQNTCRSSREQVVICNSNCIPLQLVSDVYSRSCGSDIRLWSKSSESPTPWKRQPQLKMPPCHRCHGPWCCYSS